MYVKEEHQFTLHDLITDGQDTQFEEDLFPLFPLVSVLTWHWLLKTTVEEAGPKPRISSATASQFKFSYTQGMVHSPMSLVL